MEHDQRIPYTVRYTVCFVQAYDSSFRLGSALAQINMAHELLGEEQAAREAFAAAIHAATNKSRQTDIHTSIHPDMP